MKTSLRVLELMARTKLSLYDLLQRLPEYSTYRSDLTIPDKLLPTVNISFRKYLSGISFAHEQDRITIDGLRINFSDHSWLLLRIRGTEPKIRVAADAKLSDRAHELLAFGEKIVKEFLALVSCV